jgi:large subunit ribosomal protein L28
LPGAVRRQRTGRVPRSSNQQFLARERACDPIEEAVVANVCDVCGKGPGFGMSVSHSHRRTHRRWNPNVQKVRALVAPGTHRRITVCTSCLKAGKVTRG